MQLQALNLAQFLKPYIIYGGLIIIRIGFWGPLYYKYNKEPILDTRRHLWRKLELAFARKGLLCLRRSLPGRGSKFWDPFV